MWWGGGVLVGPESEVQALEVDWKVVASFQNLQAKRNKERILVHVKGIILASSMPYYLLIY